MKLVKAGLHLGLVALTATAANAQVNGNKAPEPSLPFTMTQMGTFNFPWRIAFLPDGRMLITEKTGAVWLVKQTVQSMLNRALLPDDAAWKEVSLGKGKILFCVLPLELNDNLQAVGDIYRYALRSPGVSPTCSNRR